MSKFNIKWNLKPLSSLGPFCFGATISSYIDEYELKRIESEECDSVGWQVYGIEGHDVRINAEGSAIVSIAVYEECVHEGVNLIGMSLDELREHWGGLPEEYDEVCVDDEKGFQKVYDLDELSLQFWIDESGKVVTVISNGGEN